MAAWSGESDVALITSSKFTTEKTLQECLTESNEITVVLDPVSHHTRHCFNQSLILLRHICGNLIPSGKNGSGKVCVPSPEITHIPVLPA